MRAALSIASDHPAFAGHFPNFPVLPGALLLDHALEIIRRERSIDLTQWRIASAKFLGAVPPGAVLSVEHETPRNGLIRFTVRDGERIVATASLGNRGMAGAGPGSSSTADAADPG